MKLAKNGGSADEASLFTTHSPCYTCAGLVVQAGIRRVVYDKVYEQEAIDFLKARGITIEPIDRSSRLSRRKVDPTGET